MDYFSFDDENELQTEQRRKDAEDSLNRTLLHAMQNDKNDKHTNNLSSANTNTNNTSYGNSYIIKLLFSLAISLLILILIFIIMAYAK